MKYTQWITTTIFTAIVFVLAIVLLAAITTPIIHITKEKPINRQLEAVVSLLVECESSGNPDAVHFNDGAIGLHSRGLLQFQRPTFSGYWKGLINKDIEEVEIDNLK